jgi:hypothetical protein
MAQLLQTDTDTGQTVTFEVTDLTAVGPQRISRRGGNTVATLDERLDTALAKVRPAALNVLHTFTDLNLDNCEIEFGISLDAEAGAIIAKTSATAHFTVKLAWTTNHTAAEQAPAADTEHTIDSAPGPRGEPS